MPKQITYTAVIHFTAGDEQQAAQTFTLMRETFCNESSIQELRSTLYRTKDKLTTQLTGVR